MQRTSAIPIRASSPERLSDSIALDDLFAREYPRLVRIAGRVLSERAHAEDVAQDVFFALSRRSLIGIADPAGWLYAATVRRAINVQRGERRRRDREDREARLAAINPRNGSDEPGTLVTRAETQRSVFEALAAIRPAQAAIIALRYGGCSYTEIASALKLKPASVGTTLARAECALRKELLREPHAFRE